MTEERWKEVAEKLEEKFGILERGRAELDSSPGYRDFVIFQAPTGKMKLERVVKPRVLDVRAQAAKRIGAHAAVDITYSDSEMVTSLQAYRWDVSTSAWIAMESLGGIES